MTLRGVDAFEKAFNHYAKDLVPDMARLLQKRLAFEILTKAVERTSVITGTLRGGWQIGIGAPPSPTNRKDKDGGGTISEEMGKIDTIRGYQPVFITNLVEYAEFVEFGTDRQPAQLMLTSAVEETATVFG